MKKYENIVDMFSDFERMKIDQFRREILRGITIFYRLREVSMTDDLVWLFPDIPDLPKLATLFGIPVKFVKDLEKPCLAHQFDFRRQ